VVAAAASKPNTRGRASIKGAAPPLFKKIIKEFPMEKQFKTYTGAENFWAKMRKSGYDARVVTRKGKWTVVYTKPRKKK
jgi:hypothetical protein